MYLKILRFTIFLLVIILFDFTLINKGFCLLPTNVNQNYSKGQLIELDINALLDDEKELRSGNLSIEGTSEVGKKDFEHTVLLLKKAYLNREGIRSISVSSDKKHIAIASSMFIRVYDIENWQLKFVKKITFTYVIHCLQYHPFKNMLAYGRDDGEVGLIDMDTMVINTMTKHTSAVSTIAFNSNGRYVLSGGSDQKVVLWDLYDDDALHLYSHDNIVTKALLVGNGRYTVSCGLDGVVIIYDVKDRIKYNYPPACLHFTKSQKLIADVFHPWVTSVATEQTQPVEFNEVFSAGWERKIIGWSPIDPDAIDKIKVLNLGAQIISIGYLPAKNYISAIDVQGNIYIVQASDLHVVDVFKVNNLPVSCIEFFKLLDGMDYLAVGCTNGHLYFFELK